VLLEVAMDKILAGIGEAIGTLGSTAVLFAIAAYFVQRFFESWLQTRAKDYEAELKRTNDLELARFRQDIERQAFEHQVKFRHVYDLVANNVAEVYARLLRLCQAVEAYVKDVENGTQTKEIQLEHVVDANARLQECLLPNRIHLPPGLFNRTKELAGWLCEIADDITRARRLERDSDRPGVSESKRDEMNSRALEAWPKKQEDFANAMHLLDALVVDYQKRLGIHDEPDSEPTRAKLQVTGRIAPLSVEATMATMTGVVEEGTVPAAKPDAPAPDSPPNAEPMRPQPTGPQQADHDTPGVIDRLAGQGPPASP
jgi:hypothetical protein